MLKAGFARLDITPPLGCPVDGYFNKRVARKILDPLYLNAIALNDGERTLIMIAADVEGLDAVDARALKEIITDRTGVPSEYIVLSALHQHTSFMLRHKETGHLPSAYAEVLYAKFGDAAEIAVEDMSDTVVYSAEKETEEPIAFVRRYFLDNGQSVTNPSPNQISHIASRCAEADNTVRLLRFKREGKNDIALVNFSTHPDVIHGENISADWPGFVRRFVESDRSDVSCLFFNGAEGDSNHIDFIKGRKDGYEHSRHMGRVIANAVKDMWDNMDEHKDGKLFAEMKTIYNKSNTDGEDRYEECREHLKAYAEKRPGVTFTLESVAFARRVVEIREKLTVYRPLYVTVAGIGDVAIVGFSGEPFAEYGAAAREAAKGRFTLTFGLTNGHQGYLPSSEAFAQGGYESKASRFTPTLEAEAISAAKEMLDKL